MIKLDYFFFNRNHKRVTINRNKKWLLEEGSAFIAPLLPNIIHRQRRGELKCCTVQGGDSGENEKWGVKKESKRE